MMGDRPRITLAGSRGATGSDQERVRALLEQVGLDSVARRRVATYSLGMKQRLGIASALLGDPAILLLDEPVNGLDPDGVRWLRELLRSLALEGRTVLLSSHLMSEMAITADRLIVIGHGRLIADTTVAELAGRYPQAVVVRSARAAELGSAIERAGGMVRRGPDADLLQVTGIDAASVGVIAADLGIPLLELTPRSASLEDAYMELTADATEHVSGPSSAGWSWLTSLRQSGSSSARHGRLRSSSASWPCSLPSCSGWPGTSS